MEAMEKLPQRSEVLKENTWATEDMYVSDEAWEQELATVKEDKDALAAFAGKLGESGQSLCAYLSRMEQVNAKLELLANYCMRKADEDTRNAFYQGLSGKFMSEVVALSTAISFETPEIMAIDDETLDSFYAQCPDLERYRRYLTDQRRLKAHTLSAPEESCWLLQVIWPPPPIIFTVCWQMPI